MKTTSCRPISPTPRVLLLSASSSLNSTLRQHLYDCPDWTLSHASAPRGEVEAALVLLDVGSYDRDTNVHLLRHIGDTPVALVNAQPDRAPAGRNPPRIRGVFYRATRAPSSFAASARCSPAATGCHGS